MTDETSHILVSYKREDEVRVARLIRALQHHGLVVWWDQGLPGGEAWRANIEHALERAGCVVVVWSRGSVSAAGGFVRDEASRAAARGVLVPVLIDQVKAPLGFGEIQAVNLTHWRSAPNDPALLDLVELCRAKLENRPAPVAKASATRLFRRAATGGVATAALLCAVVALANLGSIQRVVCAEPVGQPTVSDACGAVGLGGRPTRAERVAWVSRDPKSCEALRQHLRRFPDGAYQRQALALLQSEQSYRASEFSPVDRTLRSYLGQGQTPFSSQALAEADTRARVAEDAAQVTCQPPVATERLVSASVARISFDCRRSPLGRWGCAANYTAQCHLRAQLMVESCGA